MGKKQNTRRKDGLITVQVYLGLDENKKRKYKSVYGHTQKEADEKANDMKFLLKKGIDVTTENDTFGEWGTRWKRLKELEVSHNRYLTYECNFKKFDSLTNVKISKIRAADIQEIIISYASDGLAYKTLKEIKSIASQVFNLAIENRVTDFNPVTAVKIPKIPATSNRRALTEEERQWIQETPHRAQTAAMIMLFSGLRRGELVPLMWSDIDLNAKTIDINKFVEVVNGKFIQKPYGKSHYARRIVHIPQVLVNYLSAVRMDGMLVCLSAKQTMMSESAFKRLWESYLTDLNLKYGEFDPRVLPAKRSNGKTAIKKLRQKDVPKSKFDPDGVPFVIPRITAHWLRHSFATMLYMAGVDVLTAKEQLGHADIKTTLNIYTHLDNQYKSKSMAKLDDYLDNKDDKTQTS